jgi:endonuclease G
VQQRFLSALVAICFIVQGCSTTAGRKRAPPPEMQEAPPAHAWNLTPHQQALADNNCYGGIPVETHADIGPTELVIRQGYVLEHSSVDRIPLWVCESVSADQLKGHLVRRDSFKADPELKGRRSLPDDYKRSGYDRGHQAPAGNQTVDPVLKDQTFYMSNMAPQRPSMNRGIWKILEDRTRAWVLQYGHAYEWTGPILCADRLNCERRTIGRGVTIPEFFYKIVLVQDGSEWRAIAFVVPNTDFKRPFHLERYLKSVAWIEQQTGIRFLPSAANPQRRALVSASTAMWP